MASVFRSSENSAKRFGVAPLRSSLRYAGGLNYIKLGAHCWFAEIKLVSAGNYVEFRFWNWWQHCLLFYRRPSRSFRRRLSLKRCPRRRQCWKRFILRSNANAEIAVPS